MYEIGEELVWMHIDDATGQQMNEMVVVRNRRQYPNSVYYTCQVLSTGDVAMVWGDELFRFSTE